MPWCDVLKSGPVWAIVVVGITTDWGLYVFLTNIPTYMYEVLRFDIKSVRTFTGHLLHDYVNSGTQLSVPFLVALLVKRSVFKFCDLYPPERVVLGAALHRDVGRHEHLARHRRPRHLTEAAVRPRHPQALHQRRSVSSPALCEVKFCQGLCGVEISTCFSCERQARSALRRSWSGSPSWTARTR